MSERKLLEGQELEMPLFADLFEELRAEGETMALCLSPKKRQREPFIGLQIIQIPQPSGRD